MKFLNVFALTLALLFAACAGGSSDDTSMMEGEIEDESMDMEGNMEMDEGMEMHGDSMMMDHDAMEMDGDSMMMDHDAMEMDGEMEMEEEGDSQEY